MGHHQSHNYSNNYNNSLYSTNSLPYGSYKNVYSNSSYPNISCIISPSNGIGGLYLGNIDAAQDTHMLKRLGVKSVLTVTQQANVHYDYSIVPYHLIINAQDIRDFNLLQYFDQAVNFIKQSLASTNVLVHCMAGVSRSATLVIAYLMAQKGINFDSAINYVRQFRSFINPNPGFIMQLRQYEQIISQRMMMMSSSPLSPRSFSMQNMNNANPMSMTNLDYHPGYQNSINSIRLSGVRDR